MSEVNLEQLSELQPPPCPSRLAAQLHQRINAELLSLHLVDLAARGIPTTWWYLGQAFIELIRTTIGTNKNDSQGEIS